MKENNELERSDIVVDRDMEVDCDIGQEITAYLETWFDVDRKLGTHTNGDESSWVNMYAKYNPFADTLRIECEIDTDDNKPNKWFDYEPTEGEAQFIKDMIAETMMKEYHQTPKEFCMEFYGTDDLRNEHLGSELTIGGMEQ